MLMLSQMILISLMTTETQKLIVPKIKICMTVNARQTYPHHV